MPPDDAIKTRHFRPEGNRALAIGDLISAPLVAASTANSRMAADQVRFLLNFCFGKRKGEEHYRPVTITMEMKRAFTEPSGDGGPPRQRLVTSEFELPLLTLVPLSSLAVEKVTVDFEMEITTQASSRDAGGNGGGKKGAQLMGKISYDSKEQATRAANRQREVSTRNNSSLKVNVQAAQLPLPKGLTLVLDLYAKAANPQIRHESDDDQGRS